MTGREGGAHDSHVTTQFHGGCSVALWKRVSIRQQSAASVGSSSHTKTHFFSTAYLASMPAVTGDWE